MRLIPGFGSPSIPPAPPPAPPTPTVDTTKVEREKAREVVRKSEARRAGRAATILTSGQGLAGVEESPLGGVARPTAQARTSRLLGG